MLVGSTAALLFFLVSCKTDSTESDAKPQKEEPPKKSSSWFGGLNDALDWPKSKTSYSDTERKKKIFTFNQEEQELFKHPEPPKTLDPYADPDDKKKSSVFSLY